MDEKDDESTLGAIAGYQIGNMLSVAPGPLTGVKIVVDHLVDTDRSADYTGTDIPVDENDTTSFQNQKNTSAKGGDNEMAYGPEDLVRHLASETNTTRRERRETLEALDEYREENELTIDEMDDLLEETIERYEDAQELEQETYGAIQDWAEEGIDYLKEVRDDVEGAYDWLEVIDTLHDTGRRDVERFRDNIDN